jgi:hypothetical protein
MKVEINRHNGCIFHDTELMDWLFINDHINYVVSKCDSNHFIWFTSCVDMDDKMFNIMSQFLLEYKSAYSKAYQIPAIGAK